MQPKPANFSITGFLTITRVPNLVIIALSQYFVAIFLVGPSELWFAYLTSPTLFLLSSSTIIIAASGYLINDYYDVKIDLINKPNRVIVGKKIKRRVILVWHTLLNIVGILIGFYLSRKLGIIHFGAAFLLWLYSNQLKRLPFIGNLVVALLTGVSILLVGLYYGERQFLIFIYAFFAFSFTLIREIIKDLEDWRGDETHGCLTLPIVWGLRKTKNLLYLILLLVFVTLLVFIFITKNELLMIYFGILTLPFTLFIYKLTKADSQKSFAKLSLYCKLIMLSGILSISFH